MAPENGDDAASAPADILAELAEAEAAQAQAIADAQQATARAEDLRAGRTRSALASRLAVAATGLVIGACLVLTGLMLWQHRAVSARQAHDGQIVEAARASVTALLSIDHSHARADVQRVLELSTGTFRDDFAKTADDFVTTAESQQVVTVAKIKAAALESADADGGVVLVAVDNEVSNSAGAKQDRRPFRMSVTVASDNGQYKMSSLEFVP